MKLILIVKIKCMTLFIQTFRKEHLDFLEKSEVDFDEKYVFDFYDWQSYYRAAAMRLKKKCLSSISTNRQGTLYLSEAEYTFN